MWNTLLNNWNASFAATKGQRECFCTMGNWMNEEDSFPHNSGCCLNVFVICSSVVIYILCISHLCVSLWVFAWMGWYCNLTIHTVLINCLYCSIVCAKIPQGMNLSFFCALYQSNRYLSCHFLGGLFFKCRNSCMADDIMHARQSSETLVYSWSTSYTALNDKPLILRCTVRFVQWVNILK